MSEVFEALSLLEKERGIPVDFMVDRIKKAIVTACKNSYGNEDTVINMDPETGRVRGVSAQDGGRGCGRAGQGNFAGKGA